MGFTSEDNYFLNTNTGCEKCYLLICSLLFTGKEQKFLLQLLVFFQCFTQFLLQFCCLQTYYDTISL